MPYQTFEDLDVWKRSCRVAVMVYELTRESREFSLKEQMQRSAISIASNVAEGSERSPRDFCRFLAIAKGSASELLTQLYIATRIGMLDESSTQPLIKELKQISAMLAGLRKSVKPVD